MNKLALKKPIAKIVALVFLCFSIFFLSAFTIPKENKHLTRLELAILMERIINEASIKINKTEKNQSISFSDLSKNQYISIEKVLKFKIMDGYADNTFRPNNPLRNLEVISYIQKLTEVIRNYNPDSYQAKQLFRFLSYNEEPTIAFEYSSHNFPKGLEQPNGFTPKSFANEIVNKLSSNQIESKDFIFSGTIIDSITKKPIANAYVAANNQAIAAEKDGKFSFVMPNNSKTADIFAAADGYQPIEIRKDLNLSRNITLRLKPVLQ